MRAKYLFFFAVFLGSGCSNNFQAFMDQNLAQYKRLPIQESLLAAAFSSGSPSGSYVNKIRYQKDYFSKSEEEMIQKAMFDKSELITTWTNKRYGELKFQPGKYFQSKGHKCREYKVTWLLRWLGIKKEVERGRACLIPETNRWVVEGLL